MRATASDVFVFCFLLASGGVIILGDRDRADTRGGGGASLPVVVAVDDSVIGADAKQKSNSLGDFRPAKEVGVG
jgi:hypothetical protein